MNISMQNLQTKKSYDPTWLVALLDSMRWKDEETKQHIVSAARSCKIITEQDGNTTYFVEKKNWRYDYTKTLDSKDGALILLDILRDDRIGAITTYRDIDFSVKSSVVLKEVNHTVRAHTEKQKKL